MHGTLDNDLFKLIPLQVPCPCQLSSPHYLDPICTAEPSLLACLWSPASASSAHHSPTRNLKDKAKSKSHSCCTKPAPLRQSTGVATAHNLAIKAYAYLSCLHLICSIQDRHRTLLILRHCSKSLCKVSNRGRFAKHHHSCACSSREIACFSTDVCRV